MKGGSTKPIQAKMIKKPDESESSVRSSVQLLPGLSVSDQRRINYNRYMKRATSSPIYPDSLPSNIELKPQISAPSYWHSLKDEAPPFLKPGKEPKPCLLVGSVMKSMDVIDMIEEASLKNGLKDYLIDFLVEKKVVPNYAIPERNFLISLVAETVDYAAQKDFTAKKLACLVTIYLKTHLYFKWHYWVPPAAVWAYFKEVMIRHTIEDPPEGLEIFQPHESFDIMTHFHAVYMRHLPLIHLLVFGACRLRLEWPFRRPAHSAISVESSLVKGKPQDRKK